MGGLSLTKERLIILVKEISCDIIKREVARLCVLANKQLPKDVETAILNAYDNEQQQLPKGVMSDIVENLKAAKELDLPICQDTGIAVVFLDIGQDVHITGGYLNDAVNEGVKNGYINGLLRLSVVEDPLLRNNTNSNTPAIIHSQIVPGNKLKITVAPKGFGSENMSAIKMLTPSANRETIINEVVNLVKKVGGNPCPPMVIGVGIGGTFEYAALLSKKALCRSVDSFNPNPFYKQLEIDLLNAINQTNIGPQGFGGKTTALKVNIENFATHIAGLPLAVNIGCHVTRHASVII